MRTLHLTNPPQHGARKLQEALATQGFFHHAIDDVYGPLTAEACQRAKWALGYPSALIHPGNEVAGDVLLAYLTGRPVPATYRARAALRGRTPTKQEREIARRQAIVAYWQWGIRNEPSIHYGKVRPFPVKTPRHLPLLTDCSGFFSLGYRDADCPDPNKEGWAGIGFTGTLLEHGRHITLAQLQPGDAVVFGPGTGDHVCGVLEAGGDPRLVSHGQERGPLNIRLSAERRFHRKPVTYLTFEVL